MHRHGRWYFGNFRTRTILGASVLVVTTVLLIFNFESDSGFNYEIKHAIARSLNVWNTSEVRISVMSSIGSRFSNISEESVIAKLVLGIGEPPPHDHDNNNVDNHIQGNTVINSNAPKVAELKASSVFDASRQKDCFSVLLSQLDKDVYSFVCNTWQRSSEADLNRKGVQVVCSKDSNTTTTTIDDIVLSQDIGKNSMTTRDFGAIFVDGSASNIMQTLQGATWTISMHRVPYIYLSLTGDMQLEHLIVLTNFLFKREYRLFIPVVENADSDLSFTPCGMHEISVALYWINVAFGLNKPQYTQCEVDRNTIMPLLQLIERGATVTMIAAKTKAVKRLRDPYWSGIWWDIDADPKLWQHSPSKRAMRQCKSSATTEKMMECDFIPLKMAYVLVIPPDSQSTFYFAVSEWWHRFRPCDPERKYHRFVDLIVRVMELKDTSQQTASEQAIRAILNPFAQCFGSINIQWVQTNEDWSLEHNLLMPLFTELKGKYDYFFFLRPETTPVRKHWMDKLYEDLVVIPEHFWHKTGWKTNQKYVPDKNHFTRRSWQHEPEYQRIILILKPLPRSPFGYYRLNDDGFLDLLEYTTKEARPGSIQEMLELAPKIKGLEHWLRTAMFWQFADTLVDSPPVFEVQEWKTFLEHNPSLVLANNLATIRDTCLSIQWDSDVSKGNGVCQIPDSHNPICQSCFKEGSDYFVLDNCPHCKESIAAGGDKHAKRSCSLHVEGQLTLMRCLIPKERVAVVLPINENKDNPEVFELLGNWTEHERPCDINKRYNTDVELFFKYIPAKTEKVIEERHEHIGKILQESGVLRECFNNVSFERVELPSVGENSYRWATCTHFFPNFRDENKKSFSYMLFLEEDVTPVQPLWLDAIVELISLSVDHIWQYGALARYLPSGWYLDEHRNGVAIYRLGDPWFNNVLEQSSKGCPGAHDHMLDMYATSDLAHFSKIWKKFVLSDIHHNQPPAFELYDRDWFNMRYPDTFLVHKYNRITMKLCPNKNSCTITTEEGGYRKG